MTARELGLLGEKVLKMPAPGGWVLAQTQAFGFGRVEDTLDAASQTRCGLRLLGPQGFEDREDVLSD